VPLRIAQLQQWAFGAVACAVDLSPKGTNPSKAPS
jgi:hypothetical protein